MQKIEINKEIKSEQSKRAGYLFFSLALTSLAILLPGCKQNKAADNRSLMVQEEKALYVKVQDNDCLEEYGIGVKSMKVGEINFVKGCPFELIKIEKDIASIKIKHIPNDSEKNAKWPADEKIITAKVKLSIEDEDGAYQGTKIKLNRAGIDSFVIVVSEINQSSGCATIGIYHPTLREEKENIEEPKSEEIETQ